MKSDTIIHEENALEAHCISLHQICTNTLVEQTVVIELVEREVLSPINNDLNDWLFQPQDLSRLIKANRLMQEFELSPTGLALVFDLLDELQVLRQQVPQGQPELLR